MSKAHRSFSVKQGRTEEQVKRIARKLKVPYGGREWEEGSYRFDERRELTNKEKIK